jgi:hypothetical protein
MQTGFADLLLTVGSDDVLADRKISFKLSSDEAEAKRRGAGWTIRGYGNKTFEAEGEANPEWSGSGTGGSGLVHAWFRYLAASKLLDTLVDITSVSPLMTLSGPCVVGDLEEEAEDGEFESFSYGLTSADEMTYV